MMMRVARNIPAEVVSNAEQALALLQSGETLPVHYRYQRCTCPGGWFEVVRLRQYRLVRRRGASRWELMTHQTYNKLRVAKF